VSTWLWWSSGKDSAWSLHTLREQGAPVTGLVTTVTRTFGRVSMHAVRRTLLHAQAEAAGLPLYEIPIPYPCPNEAYEHAVAKMFEAAEEARVNTLASGDLFLEDIRDYRRQLLAGTPFEPAFPIWGLATDTLARTMIEGGLRARLTCIDPRVLPREFAGRAFDAALLDDLPDGVDPCGENGEFHTFAWDGPMFARPVEVVTGPVEERDGFIFRDLLPAGQE
jgi:uncharacterized protein (TIGR00290 family)